MLFEPSEWLRLGRQQKMLFERNWWLRNSKPLARLREHLLLLTKFQLAYEFTHSNYLRNGRTYHILILIYHNNIRLLYYHIIIFIDTFPIIVFAPEYLHINDLELLNTVLSTEFQRTSFPCSQKRTISGIFGPRAPGARAHGPPGAHGAPFSRFFDFLQNDLGPI